MNNLPSIRFLIDYKITFYLIAHFKVLFGKEIVNDGTYPKTLMMFECIGGKWAGYMLCVKEGRLSCQVSFALSLDFLVTTLSSIS